MKLSKFDIGAEIIAILTKGIYPDPRDAVREYIQNSIDAKANEVTVEVGQDFVAVQDNGCGMNKQIIKDAIRIGVSDKQPGKDVGFMGIGIYSSFHLCDILEIYSKTENTSPNKLKIDFKDMRSTLDEQKKQRLDGATSDNLIGLQVLLENHVNIEVIDNKEFPTNGTRVELTGLNATFYEILSNFNKMSEYLKEVVPLHFDNNFKHGAEIEKWIQSTCEEHNAQFEVIDLKLKINGQTEKLFKPYSDSIFTDNTSKDPQFEIIKHEQTFIGVAWGCLNSSRKILSNKSLRGFLLKKQGFAIGKRIDLIPYFSKTSTAPHFNRYTGEVIIINNALLPNASRNALEHSKLKIKFDSSLRKIADEYTVISHDFQRYEVAKENISKSAYGLKMILATQYEYSEDSTQLVNNITKLHSLLYDVEPYIKGKYFGTHTEDEDNAKRLAQSIKGTITDIQSRINNLTKVKQRQKHTNNNNNNNTESKKINLAKEVATINIGDISENNYNEFVDLLDDLDLEASETIIKIFNLLDEDFIRDKAETPSQYQQILQELKQKIIEILE